MATTLRRVHPNAEAKLHSTRCHFTQTVDLLRSHPKFSIDMVGFEGPFLGNGVTCDPITQTVDLLRTLPRFFDDIDMVGVEGPFLGNSIWYSIATLLVWLLPLLVLLIVFTSALAVIVIGGAFALVALLPWLASKTITTAARIWRQWQAHRHAIAAQARGELLPSCVPLVLTLGENQNAPYKVLFEKISSLHSRACLVQSCIHKQATFLDITQTQGAAQESGVCPIIRVDTFSNHAST